MKTDSFVFLKQPIQSFHTKWEAPSNIALVKYWGKYGAQLPKNPSISFTLSYCKTTTEVIFSPSDNKVDPTFSNSISIKKKDQIFTPKSINSLSIFYLIYLVLKTITLRFQVLILFHTVAALHLLLPRWLL